MALTARDSWGAGCPQKLVHVPVLTVEDFLADELEAGTTSSNHQR
jgi:hypothetical protein